MRSVKPRESEQHKSTLEPTCTAQMYTSWKAVTLNFNETEGTITKNVHKYINGVSATVQLSDRNLLKHVTQLYVCLLRLTNTLIILKNGIKAHKLCKAALKNICYVEWIQCQETSARSQSIQSLRN